MRRLNCVLFAVVVVACDSTATEPELTTEQRAAIGTYTLVSINGATPPTEVGQQRFEDGLTCPFIINSGTLQLGDDLDYAVSLNVSFRGNYSGPPPMRCAMDTPNRSTAGSGGSWSISGNQLSFTHRGVTGVGVAMVSTGLSTTGNTIQTVVTLDAPGGPALRITPVMVFRK